MTQTLSVSKIPKIQDLYNYGGEVSYQELDELSVVLNHAPSPNWIREHPFIKSGNEKYKYIPIGIIEHLLTKIFKKYKIEILREGTSFNGVYVVVRVHYLHPITGQMEYHDGIGACQLQTKSGTSPSDLINVNNGAIAMAFPIAKTVAIKDACDHFGTLFGANLNRKDYLEVLPDQRIAINGGSNRLDIELKNCKTHEEVDDLAIKYDGMLDIEILASRKEQIKNQKSYAI